MTTYVIVDVDYWAGLQRLSIKYAGQNEEKAKAQIKECLEDTAFYNGKLEIIPKDYKDLMSTETTVDEAVEIVWNSMQKGKKVHIDTNWVCDYDEPFCILCQMCEE